MDFHFECEVAWKVDICLSRSRKLAETRAAGNHHVTCHSHALTAWGWGWKWRLLPAAGSLPLGSIRDGKARPQNSKTGSRQDSSSSHRQGSGIRSTPEHQPIRVIEPSQHHWRRIDNTRCANPLLPGSKWPEIQARTSMGTWYVVAVAPSCLLVVARANTVQNSFPMCTCCRRSDMHRCRGSSCPK
jgi:hypothetical protein